jgi:hypothetical protein
MELALPLLFLGSLYISNKNKNKEKDNNNVEGYNNMSLNTSNNESISKYSLQTNNDVAPITSSIQKNSIPTTQNYSSNYPDQSVYFDANNPKININENINNVYSMTGETINVDSFKHNNMTQFIGSKHTQNVNLDQAQDAMLDNMTGAGSNNIKKTENAPLFKPDDNITNPYGMQNQSDFYQSRIVASKNYSNIKPFESIQVGPGMNDGYNNQGSGGFNSGMESRESWMPKSVDDLRVKTNPKEEYTLDGLQGPANAYNKQYGKVGYTEHNKPDTFYENTPDKWFTTTGAVKGEVLPSYNVSKDKNVKRITGDTFNDTISGTKSANHTSAAVSGVYNQSKRQALDGYDVAASTAVGRGPTNLNEVTKSYNNYTNNRSLLEENSVSRNNIGGVIGAVIAPLIDTVRPTKRSEYLESGVFTNVAKSNLSLYNSNNVDVRHTIKETTMYAPDFNINRQNGKYVDNTINANLNQTQRETTNITNYGTVGGVSHNTAHTDREQFKNQNNNITKEISVETRHNHGVSGQFNSHMNIHTSKYDGPTKIDNRPLAITNVTEATPFKELIGGYRKPQILKTENEINDRNDADLLKAFIENPYTHSLSSVA